MIVIGSVVVVLSWTIEFQQYSSRVGDTLKAVATYVPQNFPWIIFFIGEAILIAAIYSFWRRTRTTNL